MNEKNSEDKANYLIDKYEKTIEELVKEKNNLAHKLENANFELNELKNII